MNLNRTIDRSTAHLTIALAIATVLLTAGLLLA